MRVQQPVRLSPIRLRRSNVSACGSGEIIDNPKIRLRRSNVSACGSGEIINNSEQQRGGGGGEDGTPYLGEGAGGAVRRPRPRLPALGKACVVALKRVIDDEENGEILSSDPLDHRYSVTNRG